MRILLVDDEKLARLRLRTLLSECAPEASLSEAADVMQAMQLIQREHFDCIFLDIQMPQISGLNLARELTRQSNAPAIVFVTAHAEHALQAFDLNALDYLTKPVSLERLKKSLGKITRTPHSESAASEGAPSSTTSPSKNNTIIIHDRGRVVRVPITEILYFKAELKYITVRTLEHTYVLDGSLGDLETQFSHYFLRVHRNALVAKQSIVALEKSMGNEDKDCWMLRLRQTEDRIPVSRRQLALVRTEVELY